MNVTKGNMWAQNWDSLLPLLLNSSLDVEAAFQAKKYKVEDMLRHAEDFYVSLGMEKMPPQFWSRSQILKPNRSSSCHATAANMYTDDDFRLLMCAQVSLEDFYVIHHEMGHIQYYISYKDQPTIFQVSIQKSLWILSGII
ncbi:hypothetical protein J6590_009295 [Homalodisca vitripennis]|nr:hypothetical protein J6590_009295 [Homalodisca vitripennis]